jgi:PAS domain S-box-containing protein
MIRRNPKSPFLSSATEYITAASTVALLGVLLSLGAFRLVQNQLNTHQLLEFQWVAENRHRALSKEIDNELEAVESVRDLFLVSDRVTGEEFRGLARALLEGHRGIHALGWMQQIQDSMGGPAGSVARGTVRESPVAPDRQSSRTLSSGSGDGSAPVLFIEPDPGPEVSSQLDFAASPRFKDLMNRARSSGEMAVSRRIALERQGQYGFVALLPVYGNGNGLRQSRARGPLLGYAFGVFRIAELATAATSVLEPRGVDFLVLDQAAPEAERFLDFYPSRIARPREISDDEWQTWLERAEPTHTQTIRVADQDWSITSAPTPEFRSAGGLTQGPWIALVSGLTVTVILTLYLIRVAQNLRVRTKMERALGEREELFRQMTEAIQEVFWIQTPDGSRVLYVSPAYETIWGRSCASLYREPSSCLEGIHPDDRPAVEAALGRIPNGESEQVFRVLRPDGSLRWVRSRTFTVSNEEGKVYRIAGIREDITEIKLAEQALRKSEKQLRALFDQSPDVIKTVDDTGCILSISRALPGLPVADAIGRSSVELLPPEYRKRYKKALKKAFRKGRTDRFQYVTEKGEWWELRIVPIRREEGVVEAMVVDSDVTETKDLEAKSIRSARLATLGVLSAGVAHEINNPNNAIQFNVSVLARVLDDTLPIIERYRKESGDFVLGGMSVDKALETVPQVLKGIRNGSLRIQRIVGNLKQMSRDDKGDRSRDVDVLEVIRAAVSILRNQIEKRTDRFELDLPDALPTIKGNAQELEQVFINIVMNALQALADPTKGVRIAVSLSEAGTDILVAVSDEGCGIPEDNITRVTQPFYTTREESGGTGLGMSISDTIIRRHEGRIEISSELGVGTRVTVRLPVSRATVEVA